MKEEEAVSAPWTTGQVSDLIEDRYPEGVVRQLERSFGRVGRFAEDAVAEAMVKLLVRSESATPVENPRGYVYRVAENRLKREHERATKLGIDLGDPSEVLANADRAALGRLSDEEMAEGQQAYELFKEQVEGWRNDSLRVVTLLYLEAAYLGEPLTLAEAADLAGDILGEEISIPTVSRKRKQGFERLKDFVLDDYNY